MHSEIRSGRVCPEIFLIHTQEIFTRGNTACCVSTLGYWDLRSDAYLRADHCRFLWVNHLSDYSANQMKILPNGSFHYILKVLWSKFKFAFRQKNERRERKAVVSSAKVPTLMFLIFTISDHWWFIKSLAGKAHHELWLGKAWLASSKGNSPKTLTEVWGKMCTARAGSLIYAHTLETRDTFMAACWPQFPSVCGIFFSNDYQRSGLRVVNKKRLKKMNLWRETAEGGAEGKRLWNEATEFGKLLKSCTSEHRKELS